MRQATARFASIDTARAAGYTQQYPEGCAQSPDGVQGFHVAPGLPPHEFEALLRARLGEAVTA